LSSVRIVRSMTGASGAGRHVRIRHVDRHALADRVFVRKVGACQRLADQDDVGLLAHLAVAEQAAAEERHVHRLQEAVVADADVGDVALSRRRRRLTLDGEARAGAEAGEREIADRAHRLDAGQL
jgi:hypothetical protein